MIGSIPILLPSNAGLIERIAVSPDKRYGIGFAGPTIVRVDISPTGLAPSAVLLLGSIDAGDVWFARSAPARERPDPVGTCGGAYVSLARGHRAMGPDGAARC